MQALWKLVASPRHLMVFEAAARLGSFTRAAEEINVQQPAVSAAIRQLEEALGVALFQRSHRRVELTAAGLRLFSDVTRAFADIQRSAEAIHHRPRHRHVTLNASSAFNYYWMMPRLGAFHKSHADIDLRLQNSDREPDIEAEGIDLAVRRGDGAWPGCDAALIAPEVIYPVASPSVMEQASGMSSVADLLRERLIHLEEPIRERPGWADWFAHHGVETTPPEGGLRLNDYALVLQAAIAGEGFAFGWEHVTSRLVAQGLLRARRDWDWTTGRGFYLVWTRSRTLGAEASRVRDWILRAA